MEGSRESEFGTGVFSRIMIERKQQKSNVIESLEEVIRLIRVEGPGSMSVPSFNRKLMESRCPLEGQLTLKFSLLDDGGNRMVEWPRQIFLSFSSHSSVLHQHLHPRSKGACGHDIVATRAAEAFWTPLRDPTQPNSLRT